MDKTFDPKRIEAVFTLVSSVKENLRQGALNAAMANLIKALQFYLNTPMLKKEKEVLEDDFYDLQLKIAAHPKFLATYGPVTFRKGEHKMAIEFMGQLIQFASETVKEKIIQGQELLEADRLTEAKEIFQDALESPAAELDHFIMVGDSYLKKGIWPEAQEVFSRAVERYPDSINLLNRLAISLRKNSQFAEALSIYRKALLLSPRDEGLYFNVARLFMDWGKPENAGQALRKALALNPKFEAAAKLLDSLQESLAGSAEETKKET